MQCPKFFKFYLKYTDKLFNGFPQNTDLGRTVRRHWRGVLWWSAALDRVQAGACLAWRAHAPDREWGERDRAPAAERNKPAAAPAPWRRPLPQAPCSQSGSGAGVSSTPSCYQYYISKLPTSFLHIKYQLTSICVSTQGINYKYGY